MKRLYIILFNLLIISELFAQNIKLPEPQKKGGMPLMEALAKRETVRDFSTKELSMQQISNLLWATFGINRENGKRTAPSARNFQETDIYVLIKQGVFTYNAKNNELEQVLAEDLRPISDKRTKFQEAPVSIMLISDLDKISGNDPADKKLYTANIDAGYISQNIYLFCTSEGLVTGARGGLDRTTMSEKLKLRPTQNILLIHSVGFPKQ